MAQSKELVMHKPLMQFFYGSLAVIIVALGLSSYYISSIFIKNEKNRASISSVQLAGSINSELRYIVEEFFTGSHESVFMRVSNSLNKFGNPKFELFLFNNEGQCLVSKNQAGADIPCRQEISASESHFLHSTDLKLGTSKLGQMKVLVEDTFKFFTGSPFEFALKYLVPVFSSVIILWILWTLISRKYLLNPYLNTVMAIEKEKVSTDIIQQIIHDTKGEIAALDLLTYEIDDPAKANEIRKTLHNIREAFGNLSHHKEGIITSVREIPQEIETLLSDFTEQQKIKYKRHLPEVNLILSLSDVSGEKVKVDANSFYRVLSNLVENAVSAPNDQKTCNIKITVFKKNSTISITVADNANGIDAEIQDRLFDKGFTTKATGSGRGLHYVKSEVERWNGGISFKSKHENGRGTSFEIELPIHDKPKVVILDDNAKLLYRYKKMVERYGHQVEAFSDSTAFLARSEFFEKDTIFLLDFNLADDLDGASIAKKLHELNLAEIYLHTGNPGLKKEEYPFVKEILGKGNFLEVISRIGIAERT